MADRKPLILYNGKTRETEPDEFIIADSISSGLEVSVLKSVNKFMTDVKKITFVGSNLTVSENITNQADIILSTTNSWGCLLESAPRIFTGSSQKEVTIEDFYLRLPDGAHLKNIDQIKLDISNSDHRYLSVPEQSDTWYYIYVTDDFSSYPAFGFFDTVPPNELGEHSVINARFIGSVFNNNNLDFLRFDKSNNIVHLTEDKSVVQILSSGLESSFSYQDIKKYVPKTAGSVIINNNLSSGYLDIFETFGGRNSNLNDIYDNQMIIPLDGNFQLGCRYSGSQGTETLYFYGYIENIFIVKTDVIY